MKKTILGLLLAQASVWGNAQMLREDISLSDPFVMADPASEMYYMTGTAGEVFRSPNLEIWTKLPWAMNTEGISWIGKNHTTPAPGLIWAPELYCRNGAYYEVVTFTNPDAKTEGTNHSRRSIHILRSNKPEGAFSKIEGSDELYLPASKMAIDGTIWEEDGKLYLVYCYEWVQAGDGAIEYVELKPDLTGTVGEAHTICSAKDGRKWNDSAVTDGPFLFRTQTGRLGMIWTSWRAGFYVQGVSYSDNGKINGNWTHSATPITPDNHGHGMLFRTFDGQLLMSVHSNRNIDLNQQRFERHPTLFVMDDSGDELRAVMEYKNKYGLDNPSNVVVTNPGFDYSTNGWNCTSDAVNKGIASNQGGTISGKFFENWDSNSFVGEIWQEVHVPNGTYRLTASAFRSYPIQGGSQDSPAVKLFANNEVCEITDATPKDYSVTVYVTNGMLRFGIRSEQKNWQWMGIDNVKLQYYGQDKHSDEEIDADRLNVYLRNVKSGKYLNAGESWGTKAIMSDHAMNFRLVELPNGIYALDSKLDNGGGNHYAAANGYLDGALTEFHITLANDGTYNLSTDGSYYWSCTSAGELNTKSTNRNLPNAKWEMLTQSDLKAELNSATPETPADATFLISCPGFGRNDTRISAWQGEPVRGGIVTNMCAEASKTNFNIYQELGDVPNGFYELRMQGFYRDGSAQTAAMRRKRGTEKQAALLYANETTTPLASIFDEANHGSLPSTDSDDTSEGRIPASLNGASAMFSAGCYANSLIIEVTDGKLTVGVKTESGKATDKSWVAFDNVELYYLGKELNTSIKSAEITNEAGRRHAPKGIYDFSGRKMNDAGSERTNLPRGFYIKDGVKIRIK